MSKILSKGKRKDWRELPKEEWWVEGCALQLDDGSFLIATSCMDDENEGTKRMIEVCAYEIEPETLCRYTGLTDKKGENIFEGDIIMDIDYGFMKCVYLHGSFVWFSVKKFFWIELEKYTPNEEVIGNIFDNPELLEEKS